MVRRKLTLKRVDPWSVLKFGFVLNIALLVVAMIGFWVIWTVIGRLGLVDSFCDSVGEVFLDLEDCGLNFGPLFRTVLLLGALGVIAQTGIMVFGAFLYNLIADLTGGLQFSFLDDSGEATLTSARRGETVGTSGSTGAPVTSGPPTPSSTPAPYVQGQGTSARSPAPPRPASPSPSPQATSPRSAQPRPDDDTEKQVSRHSLWGDRD